MPAARPSEPDPYELLGVPADASSADIARAYRRLARALHPDSRPGDPAAASQFQAVTLAYEVLSDTGRRAALDQQRPGRVSWSRPLAPGGAGGAWPPVWPLDLAAAGAPVAAPRRGVLRAGPVMVEPAPGSGSEDRAADLTGHIGRFLSDREHWPW